MNNQPTTEYLSMTVQQISPIDLQYQLSKVPSEFCLVDVREPFEYEIAHIKGSLLIPMQTIAEHLERLDKTKALVIICHHGIRSQQVAYFLEQRGFKRLFNLSGGIDAWSCDCNKSMVRY